MKRQEMTKRLRHFGMTASWPVRLAWTILLLAMVRPAPAGSIELLSRLPSGYNQEFFVSNDLAFKLDSKTLTILNIADPLKPVEISQLGVPFSAFNLTLSADRNWLYLSGSIQSQPGQLAICDIHNPAAPVMHGPLTYPGGLRGLALNGVMLGLALKGEGLRLMDATDPTSPVLRGQYPEPNLNAVVMAGHFAYLATNTALRILDVSDPTSPTLAGELAGGYTSPLVLSDHYLYVNNAGSLRVVDVADPAHPVGIGDQTLPGNGPIMASGTRLFCTVDKKVVIYNISDPAHPVRQGECDYPDYHYDLSLSGDVLFLNNGGDGINLVNVHDPTLPVVIGRYPIYSLTYRTYFNGTQAYLLQPSGIQPIDFSNPAAPVAQRNFPISEIADFTWDGQRLYALAGTTQELKLLVIDHADPSNLKVIGQCLLPWGLYDTASVKGLYLEAGQGIIFVRNVNGRIDVADVRDPRNPKMAGTLGSNFPPFGSIVTGPGNLVYLTFYQYSTVPGGIQIIDFTDPAAPRLMKTIKFNDYCSLYMIDGLLHTRSMVKELVYNLADPVHPRLVDYQNIRNTYFFDNVPELRLHGHNYYLMRGGHSGQYTLDLIDRANPDEPRKVGQYVTTNYSDTYLLNHFTVGDETYSFSSSGFLVLRYHPDPPPPIFVGTPLTMQYVSRGDQLPIHWQTDTRVAGTGVRLELRNSQGLAEHLTEASSEVGDTTTTVPIPALPDGSYTVRATSIQNPQLYADSLIPVNISGGILRLLSPVGGETWQPGQTVTVRWTGDPDKVGAALRFELWRGSHKLADLGTAPVPGGEVETRLTLPANLEPGTDYYLLAASQSIEAVFAQNPAPIILSSGPAQSSPAQ